MPGWALHNEGGCHHEREDSYVQGRDGTVPDDTARLAGPRREVCRSLQKHKVFLPDHARASKVHSVLPCFVDVALNVVGTNRVFNPVTIINACEQASGPLVPLKM